MSSREFLTGYRLRQTATWNSHGPPPSGPPAVLTREERKGWEHAHADSESGFLAPFLVLAFIPNPGEAALPHVVAEGCFYDRFGAEHWARKLLPELEGFKFRATRKKLTGRST